MGRGGVCHGISPAICINGYFHYCRCTDVLAFERIILFKRKGKKIGKRRRVLQLKQCFEPLSNMLLQLYGFSYKHFIFCLCSQNPSVTQGNLLFSKYDE